MSAYGRVVETRGKSLPGLKLRAAYFLHDTFRFAFLLFSQLHSTCLQEAAVFPDAQELSPSAARGMLSWYARVPFFVNFLPDCLLMQNREVLFAPRSNPQIRPLLDQCLTLLFLGIDPYTMVRIEQMAILALWLYCTTRQYLSAERISSNFFFLINHLIGYSFSFFAVLYEILNKPLTKILNVLNCQVLRRGSTDALLS